ncbi:MAG: hypothetical protein L0Z73_17195, partial [Gammaproteobacteria bacterium]|nr:hypothetical protein [Gammaproteobacteria bacterium]
IENVVQTYLNSHPQFERLLLVVDRFEELFTACPDKLRERFVEELAGALESSRFLLLTAMRDEFYSTFNRLAPSLAYSEHKAPVDVPEALQPQELVDIIEKPAQVMGLRLEDGLTNAILKDVGEAVPNIKTGEKRSAILPLLEFTLTQLWERRQNGLLTHDAYLDIEGVTGSLARWADDAWSDLPKADRTLAQRILIGLVRLGDKSQSLPDTSRRMSLKELGESEMVRRIVKYFVDRRLLVTSSVDGNETVEMIHDALVHEWIQLQEWVDTNRDFLAWKQGMEGSRRRWVDSETSDGKRDLEQLLRGRELKTADDWLQKRGSDLTLAEQEYVQTSIQRGKLLRRRKWAAVIGITLALVAASIYILIYYIGWRKVTDVAIDPTSSDVLVANNAWGIKWRKKLASPITKVFLDDLDEDGKAEIIVGMGNTGDKIGYMTIFDGDSGKIIDEFNVWETDIYMPGLTEQGRIIDFEIAKLYPGDNKQIIAIVNGIYWYPSMVTILSYAGGEIKRSGIYWHPGFLYKLYAKDFDEDGIQEIIVSGVNNHLSGSLKKEGNIPVVFLLEGNNITGEAPPWLGMEARGTEAWYYYMLPQDIRIDVVSFQDIDSDGVDDIQLGLSDSCTFYLSKKGDIVNTGIGSRCTQTSKLIRFP